MTTTAEAWHEWRGRGLGASDVGAVLGISPFASAFTVYAEKAEGVSVFTENEATDFGKRAEKMLAEWFHDRTGLHVVGEQTWCSHREHAWCRATVDGFVAESEDSALADALGVWEAKTTGASSWAEMPPHIQAQVQWQLFVTGMEHAWVSTLHGRRFEVYEVERDEADIAFIFGECERFWRDHVLAKVPPAVDPSDLTARTLAALYPYHQPALAVEVPETLAAELVQARAQAKYWAERQQAAENELKALLGDAEVATVGGVKVATWKAQEARRLDARRLEAERPDIAEQYRTTTTSRVLRVNLKESA
jgi:putative phage-type endonuclease